jgi:hypothetical protein
MTALVMAFSLIDADYQSLECLSFSVVAANRQAPPPDHLPYWQSQARSSGLDVQGPEVAIANPALPDICAKTSFHPSILQACEWCAMATWVC